MEEEVKKEKEERPEIDKRTCKEGVEKEMMLK